MGLRIDFTDVESQKDRPLLTIGWHPVKITEAEEREPGENSKTGKPYINWTLVAQPPDAQQGVPVYYNTSLSEGGLPMLKTLLEATGRVQLDGPFDIDLDDFIGADLEVKVRHGKYKGEPQAEVRSVRPLNSGSDGGGEDSILP